MLLMLLLFIGGFSIDPSSATPSSSPSVFPATIAVPGEIVSLAEGIRNEKSRMRRLELLGGLMADVKKRVKNLPENISEEEVPRVQVLYELNILLGTLKPDSINPATCPNIARAMRQMTNPSGAEESEISSPSRLVLDVVKSVCAP